MGSTDGVYRLLGLVALIAVTWTAVALLAIEIVGVL
jgi:hypothetical protein